MDKYNHTKIQQWNAFAKIVNEYYETTPFEEYTIEDYGVKEHLDHFVSNINSTDLDIPIHIAISAYSLYCSLCMVNPGTITFEQFSKHLEMHIREYVETQYGNFPDKTIAKFTPEKIQGKLEAYVDRIGKSARGEKDALRDSLKIAHFACYLYSLIKNGDAQLMP